MSDVVGDYTAPCGKAEVESLTLRFSPSSMPIQQRWRNNGLSADFLADYVSTFFPRVENDPASEQRRREISGAVKYIANELLENAMKYSVESSALPISITLQLNHERIAFWESNGMSAEQGKAYRTFIDELSASDPNMFFIEQLERNAEGEGESSGLGLLTMINDYGAQLAWKFEPVSDGSVAITTHVSLTI